LNDFAMASGHHEEIEEELAAIEAILIEGVIVERRKEDERPIKVTYQVSLTPDYYY